MIKPVDAKQLIPHQLSMRMVDQIIDYNDESKSSVIELTIDKNSPFVASNGTLDTECFLEIVAQAAAAQHGFNLQRKGTKKEKGFLVGARNFNVHGQAHAGDTLTVEIECGTEIESVCSVFGRIFKEDEEIASVGITVWHNI